MGDNQEALLTQAMQHARNGQRTEAIRVLRAYVQRVPDDPRGWWGLANLAPNQKIEQQCLEQVVRLAPQHTKAAVRLQHLKQPQPKTQTEEWLHADIKPDDDLLQVVVSTPDVSTPIFDDTLFTDAPMPAVASVGSKTKVDAPILLNKNYTEARKALSASQRSAQKNESWLYIGMVLAIFTAVIGVGAAYFVFFAGPSLGETAENAYVTINYPDNWQHQSVNDRHNTIIMSTEDVLPDGIDPWPIISNTGLLQYDTQSARYDLQYWTFYFSWGRIDDYDGFGDSSFDPTMNFQRLRSRELAMAIFQAIPASSSRPVNGSEYARALSQWFEANLETVDEQLGIFQRDVHTSIEDIDIDGHRGKFTAIQFQNETVGEDNYEALYLATVTVDDVDYLLLFNGIERGRNDWRDTAFAMAESMALQRP